MTKVEIQGEKQDIQQSLISEDLHNRVKKLEDEEKRLNEQINITNNNLNQTNLNF